LSLSNFGAIFIQPASEGVAEMLRCVRPGGVVGLTAWGGSHETEAFQLIPTLARRLFGDAPPAVGPAGDSPTPAPVPAPVPMPVPPTNTPADTSAVTSTVMPTATPADAPADAHTHASPVTSADTPADIPADTPAGVPAATPAVTASSGPCIPHFRIQNSVSSLRDLLSSAGLESIRVIGPLTHHLRCPTAEAFWTRFALAAPGTRHLLSSLSPAQQAVLRSAVIESLRARFGQGEVEVPASAYVAVGVARQPLPVRVGTAGFAGVVGHWAGKGVFPPGARTAKGDAALDFYQVGLSKGKKKRERRD
jgi:hypothetical protein